MKNSTLLRLLRFLICSFLLVSVLPAKVQAQTWYNSSWLYRKAITIDYTKVGTGPHTNFPVLINITDADLQTDAQADFDDILFTSSDGTTKLDHEVESYTSGTGALVAWVEIPTLSSSANTVIYMYYGNTAATAQQNITATWNANYSGVYHLNNSLNDATTNARNGVNTGSTNVGGKIANGRGFTANGTDNITISGLMGSPANVTLSAWENFTSMSTGANEVVSLGDHLLIRIGPWNTAADVIDFYYDGTTFNSAHAACTPTGWHYVSTTFDDAGNSQKVYLDGALIASGSFTPSISYAGLGANTVIGNGGNGLAHPFAGTLDEVRVANTPRPVGWLLTEYNNQNSPSTFYSVGAETCNPPNISQIPTSSIILNYKFTGNANSETGSNNGTLQNTPTLTTNRFGIASSAYTFNGTTQYVSTATSYANPTNFTTSIWFKTATTSGGNLIGFGVSQTGSSVNYDRNIYMNNAGKIYFGCYNGTNFTVNSPLSYNDNNWHLATATLSSTAGMILYMDGVQVATAANTTVQNYTGYWRIGYENLTAWPSIPTSFYFNGTLDDALIYHRALTSSEVAILYNSPDGAGGNTPVCAGTSLNLTATTAGGATYSWTGPNGFTSSSQNPSFSYSSANAGLYTVVATSGTCTSTAYKNITTAATSSTISYAGSPYCITGGTASVTFAGTAGGTYTSTAGLSINAATGAVTLGTSTAGSYTVTYTVSGGCTATASITVTAAPTTSAAGADQTSSATCGLTTVTLAGNTPTVGTGAWSIISGAGGTVTTPTSATSTFTGTAGTTYTLRWTISNSPCTASTDDVVITFNRNPTTSAAGADQTGGATCGLTTVTLAANAPSVGTGAWSIISGAGGTVNTPTSATSTFSGTAGSSYTLRWTVSSSPCTASTDDVVITFTATPAAPTVTSPVYYCQNATATQLTATGTNLIWSTGTTSGSVGGTSTLTGNNYVASDVSNNRKTLFTTTANNVTIVSVDYWVDWWMTTASLQLGIFDNAGTLISTSSTITSVSSVGSNTKVTNVFNFNITTAGNYSIGFAAGAGNIAGDNPGFPITETSGTINLTGVSSGLRCFNNIQFTTGGSSTAPTPVTTAVGTINYTVNQTVSGCVSPDATIAVIVNAAPTTSAAGADQTSAATCGLTTVTLAANAPSVGTGAWSIISGTGGTVTTPTSATSTFSGTAGTTYTLRWTISNSPCTASTDDVVITFNRSPTTSAAGADQTGGATCGLTTVTLAGNAPSVGTGAWSIISGAGGTVNTPTSPTSTFSGTAGTTYTLRWTISNSPCTASTDDVVITFTPSPSATISYAGSPYYVSGGTASVSFSGTTGGTYSSTAGLSINASTGAVTLGTSTPATYTVTYTIAAVGGCSLYTTTAGITVISNTKTWDGGAATNNWGDAANWNADGVPTSSDNVDLTGANTININVAATTNNLLLNNASLVLTINSGNSLAVSGNLTLTAGTFNTAAAFATVSGTVDVAGGTVGFTGSGSQTIPAYNYNNLVSSSTGARTLAGSGTIGIAGSFTPGTNSYTITGSTINYNAAGAQIIAAFYYNNLTLSNSGTKTFSSGSSAIASVLSITGSATANATTNSSAISYNGSTNQTIAALTYYELNIWSTGGVVTGINTTVTNFGQYSGTLDLNTFTLSITGTAAYIAGSINNGTVTSTGNSTVFGNTTFGAIVNATSDSLHLDGSTFNNVVTLVKNGTADIASIGGNTFNGTTSITSSGSGYWVLGNSVADIFNGNLTVTNSGNNAFYVAFNGPGNQFNGNVTFNNIGTSGWIQNSFGPLGTSAYNGNIILNNTSTLGIYFGGAGGLTTLATTKTITVGGTGFSNGPLMLYGFNQVGTTAQALTLTGTALLKMGPATTFNGNVNFAAPQINFDGGSTFNGTTYIEKSGATQNNSLGGTVFNGATTLVNSGTGYFVLGYPTGVDIFNGDVTFSNTGTAGIYPAFNTAGHQFNGNIILNSTNAGVIFFCGGTGTATLATGKTISVGGSGFSSGVLTLSKFTQVGTTAQAFSMTGTASLVIGPTSTFNGNVNFTAPQLYLNGSTYNGTATLTKNGATANTSDGGNTFNSTATIATSSSANFTLANVSADIYNGTAAFTNTGTAVLYIANNSTGNLFNGNVTFSNTGTGSTIRSSFGSSATATYSGNIVVNNTSTGGIHFGASGGTTTLATTKTITKGGTGFTTGTLLLRDFTQLGSTAQALTLTGSSSFLQIGPSTIFNGNVNFVSPQLTLNGSTFNGTASLTKSGGTDNVSSGGNIFNGVATLVCSGAGSLDLGSTIAETFNTDLTINNTGTSRVQIGIGSAGNLFNGTTTINHGGNTGSLNTIFARNTGSTATFNGNLVLNCTNLTATSGIVIANDGVATINGNIIVSSTNGRGILFGAASGSATLTSGHTITDAGAGTFTAGTLTLSRFTQSGTTAQNIALTGTANLLIGPLSQFNGAVNFSAPQLYLNGCDYNNTAALTKNGATDNTSTGANIFNAATTITNSGTGFLRLGSTTADDFNSHATFIQTGSGLLQPAFATNCTIAGNLSTAGTSTAISFGSTVTLNGTGAQSIGGVASTFNNLTISNTGNTVTSGVNASVTGNLSVTSGTFDLGSFTANRLTGGGTLTVSNGTRLKIGGTNTIPSNYTSHAIGATSTIEYSGTSQAVAVLNSSQDYGHLAISGSGTVINSGITVRNNLSITAGSLNINTYTLKIGGSISNSGTFTASSGTIELNGSSAQTIPAATFAGNAIKGLTINNTAGVTLGGALILTDVLTVSNGALASDGYLTLKSTATATARVAQITSGAATPISGNVIAERYVQGRRKYRLITSPVTTSASSTLIAGQEALSIWGNWQNGGVNTTPNAGNLITGGSSTDGFDPGTPNASLFTYDDVNRAFVGLTTANGKNTKYTPIKAGIAYLMFVYGDRLNSVFATSPHNTVLTATGTLKTGTQTYNTSSPIPLSGVTGRYTLLGNPYASPIDWAVVPRTNVTNTYWGWDPNLSSTGGYVTVSVLGSVVLQSPYSGTTGLNQYIQPGQGFFVKTSGASPVLTIREQDKVSNFNANAFRGQSGELPLLAINLQYTSGGSKYLADGVITAFDDAFSNLVDIEDASKMENSAEGLAITNASELLSIDARKMPVGNDTLFLKIARLTKPQYTLQIFAKEMASSMVMPFLEDNYLNTTSPLSLSDTNRIDFNIDFSVAASFDPDRFRIVFHSSTVLPVRFISVTATQKEEDILVKWDIAEESGINVYGIERSVDGINFSKIGTVVSTGNNRVESYEWLDTNPATGNNYYRIRATEANGSYLFSKTVVVKANVNPPGIKIFPNPIQNGQINLYINAKEKGQYKVTVSDVSGQVIVKQVIDHPGGLLKQVISLTNFLAGGAYHLQVTNKNTRYQQTIMVE